MFRPTAVQLVRKAQDNCKWTREFSIRFSSDRSRRQGVKSAICRTGVLWIGWSLKPAQTSLRKSGCGNTRLWYTKPCYSSGLNGLSQGLFYLGEDPWAVSTMTKGHSVKCAPRPSVTSFLTVADALQAGVLWSELSSLLKMEAIPGLQLRKPWRRWSPRNHQRDFSPATFCFQRCKM